MTLIDLRRALILIPLAAAFLPGCTAGVPPTGTAQLSTTAVPAGREIALDRPRKRTSQRSCSRRRGSRTTQGRTTNVAIRTPSKPTAATNM